MRTETYQGGRTWALLEAAAGGSDHVLVPDAARHISVTVQPGGGGSAELAVTTSPAPDVENGSAEWTDVNIGGRTSHEAATGTELSPAVTAIRLSATTAAATARIAILV